MLRTSSQWVKRQRPPLIPHLAASNASAGCTRWYSQPGPSPSSAGPRDSQPNQSRDTRRNPLYPNSKAAHRPHPHLRSPLFKAKVIAAPKWRDGPTDADGKGVLLKKLRIARDNGNLRSVVDVSNRFATMCRDEGSRPPAFIYYAVLHVLAANGLVEECEEVMADVRAVGIEDFNLGTAYNYALRAAVTRGDNEAVDEYTAAINALPERIDATLPQSSAPEARLVDVRNFNEYTYETLFKHHYFLRQSEAALMLFASLVKECPTSTESLFHYMTPAAATFLLQCLLEASEHRLVVQIAEWLRVESSGRLVQPSMWMHLARQCAQGDYLPGLKTAWRHAVNDAKHSPDEGLLLAGLASAARAPDSAFCLEMLTAFLGSSSNYTHMSTTDLHAPPLQVQHLMPLVEAYSMEGKFREAIRLLGAVAHWGYSFDEANLGVLEMSACASGEALQSAISAWQHVVEEGRRADFTQPPEPITSSGQRATLLSRIAEGRSSALAGQVDITTMNALLGAAARLGADDVALSLWEERRLVRLRPAVGVADGEAAVAGPSPSPAPPAAAELSRAERKKRKRAAERGSAGAGAGLHPTIETFNALLMACRRQCPPSAALGLSLMDEFLTSFPNLKPDATSFERMTSLYLLGADVRSPSSRENLPPAAHLRAAFSLLEECKKRGLLPTQRTYEALARACLLDARDERWRRLVREMVRQGGYHPGWKLRRAIFEGRYRERGKSGMRDMKFDLADVYGKEYEHLVDLPVYK